MEYSVNNHNSKMRSLERWENEGGQVAAAPSRASPAASDVNGTREEANRYGRKQ